MKIFTIENLANFFVHQRMSPYINTILQDNLLTFKLEFLLIAFCNRVRMLSLRNKKLHL